MKKYILVLALGVASYGAFAQAGLKDLKNKAEQAKNVDTDAATKAVKGIAGDKLKEVSGDQLNEVKEKVAEKVNVDASTIDGAAEMAKDAVTGKVAEKAAETKAASEEKLTAATEKRTSEMDAISGDATKVAAKNTELKAELEGKEVVKTEKKAALLTKVTSLGSKISSAEEKYSLLEKSGVEPEELAKKKSVIDSAKAKYASLTSSFK